jgi:hypothetical protein
MYTPFERLTSRKAALTFVPVTESESSADPPREQVMFLERCIIVNRFGMQEEM